MDDSSRQSRTTIFGESVDVKITGKIMMIAMLVFFFVVVFVFLLQLYARWLWSRIEQATPPPTPSQTRRRRRRFVFAPGQDPSIGTFGRGLDPSVLRSLPVLIFHTEDFKDGLECAVCLSELVDGEKARLLSKCNHGFHVDCIDMWFQSHSTCPLCRNPVANELSSSQSEEEDIIESQEENLASGFSTEAPSFPTNVLFWGDQTQVSSRGACLDLEEGPNFQYPCSSSSPSSSATTRPEGILAIDIPNEIEQVEEPKSQVTTRLRSLKRLLSRERRVSPCSPSSIELEQVGRGQS